MHESSFNKYLLCAKHVLRAENTKINRKEHIPALQRLSSLVNGDEKS